MADRRNLSFSFTTFRNVFQLHYFFLKCLDLVKVCQAIIREKYSYILYAHCTCHSFYLAINDSCEIRSIQNTGDTVKGIYSFI